MKTIGQLLNKKPTKVALFDITCMINNRKKRLKYACK